MNTLVILLIVMTVYAYLRQLSHQRAVARFEAALDELRDEIAEARDNHMISPVEAAGYSKLVDFVMDQHYFITYFSVISILPPHATLRRQADGRLNIANQENRTIHHQFVSLLVEYIKDQHRLSYRVYQLLKPALAPILQTMFDRTHLHHAVELFVRRASRMPGMSMA